jgi:hypothetical protein
LIRNSAAWRFRRSPQKRGKRRHCDLEVPDTTGEKSNRNYLSELPNFGYPLLTSGETSFPPSEARPMPQKCAQRSAYQLSRPYAAPSEAQQEWALPTPEGISRGCEPDSIGAPNWTTPT